MKKESMKKSLAPVGIMLLAVAVFVMVILDMTGGKTQQAVTKSTVAMGTVISEKLYGARDSEEAFEITENTITELENKISMRIDTSVISSLNKASFADCDAELAEVLEICNKVHEASDGAFDVTTGKITSLWKIGEEGAAVPSDKALKSALSYVDGSKLKIENGKATIDKGQLVDLGAVGKGLACDKVRSALENAEVEAAVISIGGSVLLYGNNPNAENWSVAIRDPKGESTDYIGKLSLAECAVSTSGDYERVLEVDGKKYHHILDSKTGYPADSGLMSVTVVCDSGLISDALSTAAFILGADEGIRLLEKFDAEGVFVDKDRNVFVTDGLKDKFILTDSDYSVSGDTQ